MLHWRYSLTLAAFLFDRSHLAKIGLFLLSLSMTSVRLWSDFDVAASMRLRLKDDAPVLQGGPFW